MDIKVLLVDDEKDFADALAQRLSLRHFKVLVAYSGREAIEILEKQTVDVVVLDVAMPGMDGIETLKQVKEIAPITQIIMLTGHATVDNAIEGLKNGAFDFLLKPMETPALVEKVNAAYEIKHAHDKKIAKANIEHIIASRGW